MAHSHHNIKLLHGQRGSAAIWFALCLPVLLGFAALAFDLARLNLTRVELQNAADAAALAGARLLTDPAGTKPYSWQVAENTAKDVAKQNYADAARILDANVSVDSGYWNIPSSSYSASHTSTLTGDVPAVHATVSISGLKLFFAPIFRFFDPNFITERDIQASAIAVIAPPGGGTGMFPFALNSAFIAKYWNSTTKSFSTNTVHINTTYPKGAGDGQWSSLINKSEANSYIDNLITNGGNSNYLSVGDSIWVADGAMADLYGNKSASSSAVVGKVYAVPVVLNAKPGSMEKIIALVAFQIDGGNQGGKYITGHFINNYTIPNLDPGSGNGVNYGAYTPPLLVE